MTYEERLKLGHHVMSLVGFAECADELGFPETLQPWAKQLSTLAKNLGEAWESANTKPGVEK